MLQRIQTVFLFLVLLCAIALAYTSTDVILFDTSLIFTILPWVILLLALISIFGFKNRRKQLMFNNLNIIVNILLIGLLVYWLLTLSGGISFPEKGIELAFPIISVFCLLMANTYIKRDDRLVKSVDRLR